MSVKVRAPGGFARAWFLPTALLVAMAAAFVEPPAVLGLSCTGAHQITLDQARISPTTGSTSTTFIFAVRYRDTANCAPRAVNLRIPSVGTFPMQQGSGKTFRQGVAYSVAATLPAGRWPYWFAATSGTGAGDRTVTLKVGKPVLVVDPTPVATPVATPIPGATAVPSPAGSSAPNSAAGAPSEKPGPAIGPTGDDGPGFLFQIPAIFGGPVGGVVGPWMALTGVGIAIFWVLLRRRPESPMAAGAMSAPAGGMGSPAGPARPGEEAGLPRWLRPSLHAARQAGWGVPPPRAPIRFRDPAAPGVDRREIGYRLVRVADGPDDLRSEEIGRFDRGDQVEILESKGPFVRVRGADGLEGWVQEAAIVSILDN